MIGAGADVNARGEDGDTPLFSAVMGEQVEMVHLLLQAGADPNALDRNGNPAVDYVEIIKDKSVAAGMRDLLIEQRT